MTAQCEIAISQAAGAPLNFFERYLTAWVALCIVVGIALGQFLPGAFQAIGAMEIARVNLPVGLLIWVMIIPMLLKIDFGALQQVKGHVKGIGVTLAINWLVKPFSMAFLAWLFVRVLFAPLLPADQIDSYIAGLILLAAAPCTAMVFVWSRLTNGDPYFTLSQVALNDVIMIFAFAPVVGLLLGISSITVPWATLFTSVVLYIVIPVILAQIIRNRLLKRGQATFDAAMARIQPWSVAALLLTLVLLFAFQGNAILKQPLVIALLAVPILIQVFFNSSLAYLLNRAVGEKHSVACPSALIGASNFFELAVAAAISLFGFESGAALATVVGVLIEVPVMLLVVKVVNASKGWYEAGSAGVNCLMTAWRRGERSWAMGNPRGRLVEAARLATAFAAAFAASAHALEVKFQPVAADVYAYVGDTGPRTVENEGLNANIGLVVTPAGAVLIDSGATYESARRIDEAARKVAAQPVKWVINTGGQDHRWLGNGYFRERGAEIIAHADARADMQGRGGDHLAGLKATLKDRANGTVPTLPTRFVSGNTVRLDLGGVAFHLEHRGGAHTPGDVIVWLPQKNVLFAGDVVYVDRLLGVIPVSSTKNWLATFALVEQLDPKIIVPGHGAVTNLATARADTQAYLLALRAHMKQAVDDGTDISAAVKWMDARPFMRLQNASELMPGNASRVYLEIERE